MRHWLVGSGGILAGRMWWCIGLKDAVGYWLVGLGGILAGKVLWDIGW